MVAHVDCRRVLSVVGRLFDLDGDEFVLEVEVGREGPGRRWFVLIVAVQFQLVDERVLRVIFLTGDHLIQRNVIGDILNFSQDVSRLNVDDAFKEAVVDLAKLLDLAVELINALQGLFLAQHDILTLVLRLESLRRLVGE